MTNKGPESNTIHFVDEAVQTLRAIQQGAVDAFVVEEPEGHRVYALEGADLPYSILVDRMQQGAAMLDAQGDIIYCNPSLANLLDVPLATVIGIPLQNFLDPEDRSSCQKLLSETKLRPSEGEMRLRRSDGTVTLAHFFFRSLLHDHSATGVLVTDLTARKHQEELTSRLQKTQDDERRRIARELHDSVGQLLVAISMNISRIQQEAHKLSPQVARLVDDNDSMVNEVSKQIRTISYLLHPPLLDIAGLASALRWYADGFSERSKIKVDLDIPVEFRRLSSDMEIAIFRMIQECLTNVHRHSGSRSCIVRMIQDNHRLRVEVIDSGRGIPKSKQSTLSSSGGVGLRGMQERLRQLGGTLEIHSDENGTSVIATLPIAGENADSAPEVA